MEGILNVQSCFSGQRGNVTLGKDGENSTLQTGESQCPAVWDGLTCWEPAVAGSTTFSQCPSFKGSDVSKSAFRLCGLSGQWLDRDGQPSSSGWTDYSPCLTPEIREIMRRLGDNDDAQRKMDIAANTRVLEFVGLTLSLAALVVSLLIFYKFRTLRNSRTRLHRHLFIAMVVQVGIRLIVYTDQAITRSHDAAAIGNSENGATRDHSRNPSRYGIDNTPIVCEASYICLEYARTAMFMWMFVEGLFLHNMITVTVFGEKLSPHVYPVIGWILPIPLTVAWAVVTHFHYGTATCWWGYNLTIYFWILEGPRLAVLVVNLIFLLNILRVLVLKLRQSTSSDTHQAMKAVKAALVLLPLFGLTNLLNMIAAPLEKSPFEFALWSYTTHLLTSTQGFVLAFLYCFRNGEVQVAVRKFIRVRLLRNSKHFILTKKAIPLSAGNKSCSLHRAQDDSLDASVSQTVNFVNTLPTQETRPVFIFKRIPSSATVSCTNIYFNNEMFQLKDKNSSGNGTDSLALPIIVRSSSSGVLKPTTICKSPASCTDFLQINQTGPAGGKISKSSKQSTTSLSSLIFPENPVGGKQTGWQVQRMSSQSESGSLNREDENAGRKQDTCTLSVVKPEERNTVCDTFYSVDMTAERQNESEDAHRTDSEDKFYESDHKCSFQFEIINF